MEAASVDPAAPVTPATASEDHFKRDDDNY